MGRDDDPSFGPELFAFLRELAQHNERPWFQAHKARYEEHLKEPALAFVEDVAHRLPEPGSVFRIYRDTRFAKDKSPYKTHVGIAFGRLYLHLEPGHVFMGAGTWHPDSAALKRIRTAIVARPDAWRRAVDAVAPDWRLGDGEALKRAPQGFPADHPMIEDLKRKSFAVVSRLSERDATAPGFLDEFERRAHAARPFLAHLDDMLGA
jgi:uncharacterized protein (TIGR02453 family)